MTESSTPPPTDARARSILRSPPRALLALLCTLIGALTVTLQLRDHDAFKTQLHDLGIMEQAIWQVTQGELSMPTSYPAPWTSRLARHRNVIFYALAPVYALIPRPELLLLLTPLSFVISCVLLFRLAELVTGSSWIALGAASALAANPMMEGLMLYDFRADCLAPPVILALVLAVQRRRLFAYALSLVVLLTIKEDMAWVALSFVPFVWRAFSRKAAIATGVLSLAYWMIVWRELPLLMGFSPTSPFWGRFSYLGATPEEAMFTALLHPSVILAQLATPSATQYLLTLVLQTGYLAIFAPFVALPALPSIMLNSLDALGAQCRVNSMYYSGSVVTILYAAAVYGYSHVAKRHPRVANGLFVTLVAQAALFCLVVGTTPLGLFATWNNFAPSPHRAAFDRVAAKIPERAPLATQNNLAPHFMRRPTVLEIPARMELAEYALLGIFDPAVPDNGLEAMRAEVYLGGGPDVLERNLRLVFGNPSFGVIAVDRPFYLLRRGADSAQNEAALQSALADLDLVKEGLASRTRPLAPLLTGVWLRTLMQRLWSGDLTGLADDAAEMSKRLSEARLQSEEVRTSISPPSEEQSSRPLQ